jgi:DNA-binding response OmpR family regulator
MSARKVVVADDDPDTVLTLSTLLETEGYEVFAARNGAEALDMAAKVHPDAVVLDIALPKLSGWEIARRIRERLGEAGPVLIGISGQYRQGADKILSQILGFDHYLVKPCDFRSLVALLPPARQREAA